MNGLIKAVDHLLEMIDDETKIIPGHGPLADREGSNNNLALFTAW